MSALARPVAFPLFGIVKGRCACNVDGCARVGKHPRVAWGEIEYGDVVERPELGAGAGLRTGAHPAGSDVFVVDVDSEDALERWEALNRAHDTAPCPLTYSVKTPRGWHFYFRHPGFHVKNSAGDLGKGIDVRGDGGFVVSVGSPHKSGSIYEAPIFADLADAPDWLLARLHAQRAPTEAQVYAGDVEGVERERRRYLYAEYLRDAAAARGPERRGQGDATLFEVVQRGAYDLALPVDDVLDLIRTHYDPRCSPPWGDELEERVHHKARDAKENSQRPPAPPLPADLMHLARGSAPPTTAPASGVQLVAETPISFEEQALPAFPAAVLPPVLRAFVEAEAEATQTPIDMCAMLAFGCCAAAIAGKVEVEVEAGYREPLNVFVAVAALPGERKSGVFADTFAPLLEMEREKAEHAAPLISAAKTRRDLLAEQIKRSKADLAKLKPHEHEQEWLPNQLGTVPSGGLALRRQIATMEAQLRKMELPAEPQLVADDVTMERLAGLMAEQGGRMCIASPEGTIFGIVAGRYSRNGQSSFEVLLKGHAGDMMKVDRQSKDRPSVHLEHPCLTLVLAVQPSIIQGLSADSAMRGQGLLARFLYSLPSSRVGNRKTYGVAPVPDAVRANYGGIIRTLAQVPTLIEATIARQTADTGGDIDRILDAQPATMPTIRLSAAAQAIHRAFRAEVEPRLHPETGNLNELTDWANKWPGAVARIAGVLHCVERGPTGEVSADTMIAAIAIGRYLLAHAARAFGLMLTPGEETDARAVLAWLQRSDVKSFTMRDVSRGMSPRGIGRSKPRREAAVRELMDRGFLVPDGRGWRVVVGMSAIVSAMPADTRNA